VFARFKDKIEGRDNLPLSLFIFILIYGCLILIPSSIPLRDQRMGNAAYALFMSFGFYIFRSISKTAGALILYIGLISMFSFLYALDIFMIISAFMLLYILITVNYRQIKKETIYDCLILIVAVNLAFQILQSFGIYFVSYPIPGTESYHCGLMNNVNDMSVLYAVCLPAFLRKRRWYYLPIVFAGLYMSRTLTGVLVSAVLLVIFGIVTAWKNKDWNREIIGASIIFLAASVICYSIYVDNFNFSEQKKGRLYIWEQTAKIASVKKFGWGINQFDKVMPLITSYKYLEQDVRESLYMQIYDKTGFDKALRKISHNDLSYFYSDKLSPVFFIQAHNEYLEMWFIGGYLGLFLGLLFLIRCLTIGFKQKDKIPFYGLLSACGTALLFFSWHIIPIATVTVFYIGMIEGEKIYGNIE